MNLMHQELAREHSSRRQPEAEHARRARALLAHKRWHRGPNVRPTVPASRSRRCDGAAPPGRPRLELWWAGAFLPRARQA